MNIQKQAKQLLKLIDNSKKILLINHIKMDPDAYGSTLGLYRVIQKLGKEIKATNDELSTKDFKFLGGGEIINPNIDIKKYNPDLIIALDAGGEERLGTIYINNKEFIHSKNFVVIDHHITNNGYGNLNIISKDSSSTCEIVFEIIKENNLTNLVDPEIATFLIAGIITDTNIFYNKNTTSKTLKISSELIELGANQRSVIYNFYRKKDFDKTKLWAEALQKIEKTKDGKIVWSIINKKMLEKTNTSTKEVGGLINEFHANIQGSEACFIIYPEEDGKINIRLRSKSTDISQICKKFGGGGHALAAGFTSTKDKETVKDELLKELKKALD